MKKIRRSTEVINIKKKHENEMDKWNNNIEVDDNDNSTPKTIRNIPEEYIVNPENVIDIKGNTTFEIRADKIEIFSEDPPLHKEIYLSPTDPLPEEKVEKNNIYKQFFKEIKQCPTFAVLKEGCEERLFHNPDDGQTYLKCVNKETGETIYFNESFIKEELLQYRGIDLDNPTTRDRGPGGGPPAPGAYSQLNDEQSHSIDMIVQKMEDNRSQDITSTEKAELLELLGKYEDRADTFGEEGHEAKMYDTELGRIIYFGDKAECFEEFAFVGLDGQSPNTLKLFDGREVSLGQFLKESYHVDLKGEEIAVNNEVDIKENDNDAIIMDDLEIA